MKWSLKRQPIPCPQCQSGLKMSPTLRSKIKNPFKNNAIYFQCSGCQVRFVLPNKQALETRDIGGWGSILAIFWGVPAFATNEIKNGLNIESTGVVLTLTVTISIVITVILLGFAIPSINKSKAIYAQQLLPLNAQTLADYPELDYKDTRIRWWK